MLLLKDGRIIKEKQGLHLSKKNSKCPHCGSIISIKDETCSSCKKSLYAEDEIFSN
jgi:uncharacterized OB-fold protein